jgi:flagellar protein FlaG
MDNNISMIRALPASTSTVETAPRQPAAPPPSVSGNVSQSPSVSTPPAAPEEAERVDLEALLERVGEQISEFSRQTGRELEFEVEESSGNVVILVKNKETGEVLRAIPPEEAQRLSDALAAGEPALVDLRA